MTNRAPSSHSLRQQSRPLQVRVGRHDVRRGWRGRERDPPVQRRPGTARLATPPIQVCLAFAWQDFAHAQILIAHRASVDKRTIIENYDLVSLAIDEIVDDGIILETDPTIICQRVSKAPAQDVDLRRIDPFSEQGVNNLAQLGKAKLTDWLRQGL